MQILIPPSSSESRLLSISRSGLLALMLVVFGVVQASATAAAGNTGKSLQQSIAGEQFVANVIGADAPDTNSVDVSGVAVHWPAVPRSLGIVHHDQFNPMVKILRDRMMHAPPRTA